ncbi:unnamed protein product [Didymodactylos carnosus]|uniref:Major facilitator superfamily (MFS) profile domain-containing protein n=1 Tax=Didymodactylos carnosus TaxID=1234261 RepID=A0A8S2EW96_9BILA|nr:unnamed protein product [Didymodactylos carnosus]CAF4082672.1 unnamed protein product [Didymodactylos carnosus]
MSTSKDDNKNRKELTLKSTGQASPTTISNNGSKIEDVDEGRSNDVVNIQNIDENLMREFTREEAMNDAENFAIEHGLSKHTSLFRRAALVARDGDKYESIAELTEEDRTALFNEIHHRWKQPWALYFIAAVSAMAAVVQGMDETVVNGAQLYYFEEFGITNSWLQGLINASPYLACFTISVWLTEPMNNFFGRRGTIFIMCIVAAVTSIWEAVSHSWVNLFIARFFLGISIGVKSTTVPIYTAESSPPAIRGALTMLWQTFTAFGIMLGYIMDVAFANVRPDTYLNWRLMLGSTCVAPVLVCCMVWFGPESPRWYMKKNRCSKAFECLLRLRRTPLLAARDLYYMHVNLRVEKNMKTGRNLMKEMFTVPRNRRAAQSSFLLMFMQQFCGVNIIMYYSSVIFVSAGVSPNTAILASLGAGILNFLFALPAIKIIDTWGRRPLLLWTFPIMSISLFFTGFCFWIESQDVRLGLIALGIYLFIIVYSPGEGPVPFTYAAEAFPLYIRDFGMSAAVAITWGFSFLLSVCWPSMLVTFKPQGAFSWYAAWCLIGWVMIFFVLPETKGRTLEELDQVFSVPTSVHAKYQWRMLKLRIGKLLGSKQGKKRGDVYPAMA